MNGKSQESMEYYFLAFPGNPGIKEESRVLDQSQKVKAFLHLRQSPESVENCLLAFRAFPRIPGKSRSVHAPLAFQEFVEKTGKPEDNFPHFPGFA